MKRLRSVLMILLLMSCELVVDVDVPFEKKQMTVNSFFNPDSLWSVRLSLNRHVLDDEPFQEVNDAQIVIYEEGNPIDTLTNVAPGRFRSDNGKPEPGKTYDIRVVAPAYGDLESTSSIPFPSAITSVEMYESAFNHNTMIKVKFKDDPAEENFYELYTELETETFNHNSGQIQTGRHRLSLTSEDPVIQNDNDFYSNSMLFKDVLFNGKEIELTLALSAGGITNAGEVSVTLRTMSEDGYNYLTTADLNDQTSDDPFAQPVNVYNNIHNGFGIFAGYSASVYAKGRPKPVIASIEPPAGKAGDHIIITGENFITSPQDIVTVLFQTQQYPIHSLVVQVTETRIEVIVPDVAVTGKIVVRNGRIAISASDFVVTD